MTVIVRLVYSRYRLCSRSIIHYILSDKIKPMAVSVSAFRLSTFLSAILPAGRNKRLSEPCCKHSPQCFDDEVQRLGVGTQEVVSCSDSCAVHCCADTHMERTCQPACIYRFGHKYVCLLVKQSAKDTHGKSGLRISVLAGV